MANYPGIVDYSKYGINPYFTNASSIARSNGVNTGYNTVSGVINSSIFANTASTSSNADSFQKSASTSDMGVNAVNAALGELGTKEATGANLKYTGGKQEHWCAHFVSWAYEQANGGKAPWGHESTVTGIKNWGKENGKFATSQEIKNGSKKLKVGDVVIYQGVNGSKKDANGNDISHTGIVTKVNEDGTFNTVEGNTRGNSGGDQVAEHKNISLDNSRLTGFVQVGSTVANPSTGSTTEMSDMQKALLLSMGNGSGGSGNYLKLALIAMGKNTNGIDSTSLNSSLDGNIKNIKAEKANLTDDQKKNASIIASTAKEVCIKHGVTDPEEIEQVVTIAIATALQESGLRNLDYGDRDSLGLFQQRPSCGWGSKSQVTDPVYATTKFVEALLEKGYKGKSVTKAAQDVQRSAYPDAYAKWEGNAKYLAQTLLGTA